MGNRDKKWLWWMFTTATYVVAALAYFIIPLGSRWKNTLLGSTLFAPDAILNAGILEWGYKSLWSSSLHVFDWPAGFPLDNSLANTEHLIGWQIFYSPLRWAGFGTIASYNILLLGSIIISGIGAALLAKRLGANRYGAWIAGFIFAFVPFHLNHIVHLQTMAVCWSPFAVLFLDRFLSGGSTKDAVGLAATFMLTMLFGMYFAVSLVIVLPMYLLLCYAFGRHRSQWRALRVLALTGACATIALLPVIIPYAHFSWDHGFSHSPGRLVAFSVALVDLLKVPGWLAVWSGTQLAENSGYAAAFPGITVVLLVGLYVVLRPKNKDGRRLGVMLGLLCLVMFLLSLGPVLKIHDDAPVRVAGSYIPMPGLVFMAISAIRVPMRILLYSYLFGAVLCGLGMSALTDRLSKRAGASIALLVLVLLAVEYRPQPWFAGNSLTVPEPLAMSDAYPLLAEEDDTGAVVELPSADLTGYRTPVMTRYTYGSAGHLRRAVAYHGSVRLPAVDRLQKAAGQLPDVEAHNLLRASGVTRLIVHRSLMGSEVATRLVADLEGAGYRKLHASVQSVVFALDSPAPVER